MGKNRGEILITPRSLSKAGHPALEALSRAGYTLKRPWPGLMPNEDQLLKELPGCVGYLAGVEKISRQVLEEALSLKIISRNGVGIDSIDLEAARELGIAVKGTPGANSQGVAELALTLILDALRYVSFSNSHLKSGQWVRHIGREFEGERLGLIGCGNIGQRLAQMATFLKMEVVGYDIFHSEELKGLSGFKYVELVEVIESSSIISLHCPPGEKPIIKGNEISKMREGVIVVNTARASLVDEKAMLKGLEEEKVSVYATDVFVEEPPSIDGLLGHERVIITPHIGGFTKESVERATVSAVNNILEHLRKDDHGK